MLRRIYSFLFLATQLVGCMLWAAVDLVSQDGINDATLFHLQAGIEGGTFSSYLSEWLLLVALMMLFVVSGFWGGKLIKTTQKIKKSYLIFASFGLIAINPLTTDLVLAWHKNTFNVSSPEHGNLKFEEVYYQPKNVKIKNKKNIVVITAESFERNVLQNLNLLDDYMPKREGKTLIDFTNVKEIYGTGWTIAGLTAMNCGLPLIRSMGINHEGVGFFYPKSKCLTDILKDNGYLIDIVQGTKGSFAGHNLFWGQHSVPRITEFTDLMNRFPGIDVSPWGFHDDTVLSYAKERYINLKSSDKYFALFINTVDTHAPHGYPSPDCSSRFPGQHSLKASYMCLHASIISLIDEITDLDTAQDTLIVVHSDHLLKEKKEPLTFPYGERRNSVFMIVQSSSEKYSGLKQIAKSGSMLDMPATILDILGVDDRLGLGVSLMSEELVSLAERSDTEIFVRSNRASLTNLMGMDPLKKIEVLLPSQILLNNTMRLNLPLTYNFDEQSYKISSRPGDDFEEFLIDSVKPVNSNLLIVSTCDDFTKVSNYRANVEHAESICAAILSAGEDKFMLRIEEIGEGGVSTSVLDVLKMEGKIYEYRHPEIPFWKNLGLDLYDDFKKILSVVLPSWAYEELKQALVRASFLVFKYSNPDINDGISNSMVENSATYIAHAGGQIQGRMYTNSREAVEHSVNLGLSQIEIDLILTSDKVLVGAHDWRSWASRTGFKGSLPPSYKEFMNQKIDGLFTPIDANYLNLILEKNPKLLLVTDKIDRPTVVADQIGNVSQIYMELFTLKAIDEAQKLKFRGVLMSDSVFGEIGGYSLERLERKDLLNKISGFAVSRHTVLRYPALFRQLKQRGFNTYAFHVNDGAYRDKEAEVLCDLSGLVSGIYVEAVPTSEELNTAGCYVSMVSVRSPPLSR